MMNRAEKVMKKSKREYRMQNEECRRKKLLKLSSYILSSIFCILLILSTGCTPKQSPYPEILKGTYTLTMQTDSTDFDFSIEFVTAIDSAVYGIIKSDSLDYDAPIALDSLSADSLYFHTYTHNLVLSRDDENTNGRFDFYNSIHPASMRKQSANVRESLLMTRDQLPVKLDIETKQMGWASPISGDRIYLINDAQIYLAEKRGDRWKTTAVTYDKEIWKFYSIGLSPDQSRLIAHGSPQKEGYPHQGNGDYYMLYLDTPTTVDSIAHLPASVNTDSYDIFPSFTPEGNILLSSWGDVEGVKESGRGDIFLAVAEADGYRVEQITENFNTDQPEAGASMSADGRVLLFHRSNRDLRLPDRIFMMVRTKSGWSDPELIGPPVTYDFSWTYGGRIDPTGQYLFFNSGFRGKYEIFRVPIAEIPELAEELTYRNNR